MLVLQIFRWLLLAAEIWIAIPILYLCVLSASAILSTRKRKAQNTELSSAPHFSFAILVPAQNEEVIISNLLKSLSALEYPKELYSVYIVADNSTDRTAELARATGWVHVYERFDEVKRGKGHALSWLLHELEVAQLIHSAYIILDADSVVVPTFLQSMARELAQGQEALQACNAVLNPSESPSAALRWIALTLINHVRPLGRNGLKASSTLTGNGMCLSRSLLMRHPWQAFTVTEDYEYYLTLVEHGERVRYVPEALVRSAMPITFIQMRRQDVRWESSESNPTTWWTALKLVRAGLRLHDFAPIEAAVELVTPPLSFLVGWCLLTLIASLLLWSMPALMLGLLLIGGLACYISTAFYLVHPPLTVYRALLYAPGFMIWKLWVSLVLRRNKKLAREWFRTGRTMSAK
jgi:cellulose synthase/poly-beta-1,6-N-acetylglucosamine synthase-like glycosyltransferase